MKSKTAVKLSELARSAQALLLGPKQTLSQQVMRGGLWVFALRGASRGLGLVRTVVLARILSPDDFGLMGIAMLAMSTLNRFSQTGFQAALVQKEGDIRDYLDTAWTVSVMRGLLLFSILLLSAPYLSRFFEAPASRPIIQVIAISQLLRGLTNVGIVYFQRELEFSRKFLYEFVGAFGDVLVAIVAAVLLRSVWAIVLGHLAGDLIRLLSSYVIHPYRPSPRVNLGMARELYDRLGKHVFAQSIILFLITQGDDAFVGKLLGASALGLYQLAYRFSNMGATEITHVVSQVTFPAYSRLQHDEERLTGALKRTLRVVSIITVPMCVGLFVIADGFTRVILGDQWMQMVPALRVLCFFGLVRSLGATFGPAYKAQARLDLPLRFNVIELLILAVAIYPLSNRWGITGTAIAVSFSALPILYLTGKHMSSLLRTHWRNLFKPILVPIAGATVMSASLAAVSYLVEVDTIGELLLSATVGTLAYAAFVTLADRNVRMVVLDYLRSRFVTAAPD